MKTNRSNHEYMYGNPYWLEVKLDSKWYTIPFLSPYRAFTANTLPIETGEKIKRTLDVKEYPTLTNGQYRIVNSFTPQGRVREITDTAVLLKITNSDVTDK